MWLLHISRNCEKCLLMHCYCHSLNLAVRRDTIKNIPLLKDTLDMACKITKLIKKNPKSEAEFHGKQAEFLGQMECDFHVYDMDLPTLKILCCQVTAYERPSLHGSAPETS